MNLGNTCYMNATLQVLRSIPEMQENLNAYGPCGRGVNERYTATSTGNLAEFTNQDLTAQDRGLTTSLRDLYRQMSETPDAFNPMAFLQVHPHTLSTYGRCFEWRCHNLLNEVVNQIKWRNKTLKNAGPKSSLRSAQPSNLRVNKSPL